VLLAADNLEALPIETPTVVLELFDVSDSAYRIVVEMVSEAMLVAEGVVPDFATLVVSADEETEDDGAEVSSGVRLTPLDPQRPALDLLEDLLTGIGGCRLLYAEYADSEGEVDAVDVEFADAVRQEAQVNGTRLM